MDRLQNAQSHLGLLISFTVLTVLIFIARTALQWHRPLRTPDKICNALFAYSCASNIGNIAGLMYKCTEEIAVRKKIADGAGAVEEQEELDRLLLGPHWLKVSLISAVG